MSAEPPISPMQADPPTLAAAACAYCQGLHLANGDSPGCIEHRWLEPMLQVCLVRQDGPLACWPPRACIGQPQVQVLPCLLSGQHAV